MTDQGRGVGRWSPDPEGFDLFYEQTRRGLLREVFLMCGELSEAQDCVQEAYVRAWQRWRLISEYDRPEAWVRTVAFRLAVGQWRKRRAARRAWRRVDRTAVAAGPRPDSVALLAALGQIDHREREAVVLHHLCQFTITEISELIAIPEGTVKSRLSRGRSHLASLLGEEGTGD